MKIYSPFQMNDWPLRTLIITVISLQLLVWGTIVLESFGFEILIIRQFFSIINILVVPGILSLRILKLHKLDSLETLLYTVGLSISIIMFTGFVLNFVYPMLGIIKPISIFPLLITLTSIIFLLCSLSYIRDRNYSSPSYINLNDIFTNYSLYLYLILLLTIIGTYLMNTYNENLILLLAIVLIALNVIIIGCSNKVDKKYYPLTVFILALALLYHNTLISLSITGWDIQSEYYLANKVMEQSLWDLNTYSNANAMLSIVMLAPITSIVSEINLSWILKIIYPLIYSLVSLGLFSIFKKQTTEKTAFFATFLFISIFMFYIEMPSLIKQQIAEFYFVLVILLILNHDLNNAKFRVLLIIFAFSTIVSHYGLSYILIGGIFFCSLIESIYSKYSVRVYKPKITFSFFILYSTVLLTWYMNISSSSTLDTAIYIVEKMYKEFVMEFLNPNYAQGLYILVQRKVSILQEVSKYIQILVQYFISTGLLYSLYKYKNTKFEKVYLIWSIYFYLILLAAIVVPNFANNLNTSRLYQISLIFLSPFCVIGGFAHESVLKRYIKLQVNNKNYFSKLASIFFVIFLLFNTGWIYEVANDSPTSISFNNAVDYPRFNEKENRCAEWIFSTKNQNPIYSDYYRHLLLNRYSTEEKNLKPDDNNMKAYVYIGTFNFIKKEVLLYHRIGANFKLEYTDSDYFLQNRYNIYSNGGAQVYL